MKETSPTGYIVHGEKPNLRTQDGEKRFLLCESCELILSRDEKLVCENLFLPYQANKVGPHTFGEYHYRFAAALIFKAIARLKKYVQDGPRYHKEWQGVGIDACYSELASYLLKYISRPTQFRIHFIPLDIIEKADGTLPSAISRYLSRALDLDIIFTN